MARKRVVNLGQVFDPQVENQEMDSAPVDSKNYEDLKREIERAYNGDVTIDEAERLAARFLMAQMEVAQELSIADLDARMKKNGLKTHKAFVYMEAATKGDKKPSEGFLENHIALDPGYQLAQRDFDSAENRRESMQLYLGIFKDAHIYFRGISKGRYE